MSFESACPVLRGEQCNTAKPFGRNGISGRECALTRKIKALGTKCKGGNLGPHFYISI
jgi:hypothetical protein